MDKNENKEKVDINRYQDLEGLSTKKLNFGLWFVNNRKRFVTATIVILILLSAGFFFYSGYHYTYYLLEGKDNDEQLLNELSRYEPVSLEYKLKNSARDLQFYKVETFSVDGSYDLVAKISNPNDKYYANYSYCFVENDIELACDEGFIFPLESKYLLALAIEREYRPQVQLRMKSIGWTRVNLHKYPDWESHYNDRLNFTVSDIRFKPARKSALSENLSLDVLEFEISNDTAFGYWQVPLNIVLFSGNQIVGVNRHVLDGFISGETRSARLVWSGNITSANEVQVIPTLDIVDESIYIKY